MLDSAAMNIDLMALASKFPATLWDLLLHMSPYLLLGFAVAALLHVFLRPQFVLRHLSGRGLWPTLKGALLGAPMPLCSCSVLPVAAGLRRQGAGRGATTAFLISSPQTGADNIAITWAMLGPLIGIFSPIAALLTGITGGLLAGRIKDEPPLKAHEPAAIPAADACCDAATDCAACDDPLEADAPGAESGLRRALRYGFVTLPRDLAGSLIFGILLAALITVIVPPGFFGQLLPPGPLQMLAMLALSIPLYVCSTSSVPLAAAFIFSGITPGAAIVFLVAGPSTNMASITTVNRILGFRNMLVYLLTIVVSALVFGLLLDRLIDPASIPSIAQRSSSELPLFLSQASAVLLCALLLFGLYRPRRPQPAPVAARAGENETILAIEGMHCGNCSAAVENALARQSGVSSVSVDLKVGRAVVRGEQLNIERLVRAVEQLGYSAAVV